MYIIQIWILFLQLSFNCASLQDHLFYLLPATKDQLCPPGCLSPAHTLSLPLHLSPGLKWPLGSTLISPDHQKTTDFHSEDTWLMLHCPRQKEEKKAACCIVDKAWVLWKMTDGPSTPYLCATHISLHVYFHTQAPRSHTERKEPTQLREAVSNQTASPSGIH